jgi:hypothetical protein
VAITKASAHDAVLAAAGVPQAGDWTTLANEMIWLCSYEQMMARKQKGSSDNDNSTETSVDAALAMYWP